MSSNTLDGIDAIAIGLPALNDGIGTIVLYFAINSSLRVHMKSTLDFAPPTAL